MWRTVGRHRAVRVQNSLLGVHNHCRSTAVIQSCRVSLSLTDSEYRSGHVGLLKWIDQSCVYILRSTLWRISVAIVATWSGNERRYFNMHFLSTKRISRTYTATITLVTNSLFNVKLLLPFFLCRSKRFYIVIILFISFHTPVCIVVINNLTRGPFAD